MFLKGLVVGLLLIIIGLCLVAQLKPQVPPLATNEIVLGGYRVKIERPDGYCSLAPSNQIEKSFISGLQQKIANSLIVAVFARCDQLDRLRDGDAEAVKDFGFVYAKKQGEGIQAMPGLSRFEMLAMQEKEFRKINDLETNPTDARESRDDAAVYMSTIRKSVQSDPPSSNQVVAVTLINSVPLIILMNRAGISDADRNAALKEQSAYVHDLLKLNDEINGNLPTSIYYKAPITVGDVTLVIGLICLGGVLAFWHPGKTKSPSLSE